MDLIDKILAKVAEGMGFKEAAELFRDELMSAEFALTKRYQVGDLTAPHGISYIGEITTLGDHYKKIDDFLKLKVP
jgi:hypothetical protein